MELAGRESESLSGSIVPTPSENNSKKYREGIALCLSGGGYRAMLFHTGSVWRLYQMGLLPELDRISSVSGGSIIAGLLGLRWSRLVVSDFKTDDVYTDLIVNPIRALASATIDVPAVLLGFLLPGSISNRIAGFYKKHLFKNATLQDFPDHPRFVINSANLQSGALWRFMKPYMRDWKVGEVKSPAIKIAKAVAASSAFPPILSPTILKLKQSDFEKNEDDMLVSDHYRKRIILTDAGVYDNLGLETANRFKTVLVSNAGGEFVHQENPAANWMRQAYRVLQIIDNQVRSLRKCTLIGEYKSGEREGTYWSIASGMDNTRLEDALQCPLSDTTQLAAISTRLKKLDDQTQKRLINWGYASCDAAIRKYYRPDLKSPDGFPYPEAGV
ncbi:MAG: patatin-like phospholipase family protein [Candidatus Sabulitectum sp.]|nr:patatin-like phospholipase family protein [Candidatus Sabulitectum sp.]